MSASDEGPPVRVFLSGVKSPAHLVYVASYLRFAVDRWAAPTTLVDLGVGAFLDRLTVSSSDVRSRLSVDPRLSVTGVGDGGGLRGGPGERLVYVAVGAPGIKPLARLRAANRARRLHVVVTDEGLGSYGDWRTRRDAWQRESGRGAWPWVRALAVTGARRLLTDERWALYRRDSGSWRVDERVATEFRRGSQLRGQHNDSVVFLSQPWVELGVIDERDYLDRLREVASACDRTGFALRLRPHPREEHGRYAEFTLDPGQGPAELDPSVVSASAVIGTTSTALLNIAAIHGRPAARISLPGLAALDERLSARQRSLLDAFLPPAAPVESLPRWLHTLRA